MRGITLLVMLSSLFLLPIAPSRGQEPGARDMWLESRAAPMPTPKPKPPAPTPTPKKPGPSPQATPTPESALGLGYSLFLQDEKRDFAPVKPTNPFRSGDLIQLLVESNKDGYLYVFNQEDNGSPIMLFPNLLVQGGDNHIWAHEPLRVPAGHEFEFDANSAKETLTLVISQDPIAGLAVSKDPKGTPVPEALFRQVSAPTLVREGAQLREGKLLTKQEGRRGFRLHKDDPLPDNVLINRDRKERRIVAQIRLTHR